MTSEGGLQFHAYDPAHKAVHMLVHPCQRAALLDSRKYAALIYLFYNEGYGKHGGRLHYLECLHQQRCHRRFRKIIDRCAAVHRVEHAQGHFKCVRHRKHRKPSVLFTPLAGVVAGYHVGSEVPVAEHNSLSASCGA